MKKCPECGVSIANQAIRCPKCRFDFSKKQPEVDTSSKVIVKEEPVVSSTNSNVADNTTATKASNNYESNVVSPVNSDISAIPIKTKPFVVVNQNNVNEIYSELKSKIVNRKVEFDKLINFLEEQTQWLSIPLSGDTTTDNSLLIRSVGVASQLLKIKELLAPSLDDETAIILGLFHCISLVEQDGEHVFGDINLNDGQVKLPTSDFVINNRLISKDLGLKNLSIITQYINLNDDEIQALAYATSLRLPNIVLSPFTIALRTAIELQKFVFEVPEAITNYAFPVS